MMFAFCELYACAFCAWQIGILCSVWSLVLLCCCMDFGVEAMVGECGRLVYVGSKRLRRSPLASW